METNRVNSQHTATGSNTKQDQCILRLSILTVCLCSIIIVTVTTLHWIWLSSHSATTLHTMLLIASLVFYTITLINSFIIIFKIDKRITQNEMVSEQHIGNNGSENIDDTQRITVDHISFPNARGTRFGDFTPPPTYAQTVIHRGEPRITRSRSERTISQNSTNTSTRDSSRNKPEEYFNHHFEMNEAAAQQQHIPHHSDNVIDALTKYVSDTSREQRTSSQVEPIYENVTFPVIEKLSNTGPNVFDFQKHKCEKLNMSKLLKSNVDISELNNGQQLIAVRKSPARSTSFQKSIAQKIYSKHTTEGRSTAPYSSSANVPPTTLISDSRGSGPDLSSEIHASSSRALANQYYGHANSASAPQHSRNRPINSASSSNPYISSERQEQCEANKVTSFSSGSPRTSSIYKISPARKMFCDHPNRVIPAYSDGALNRACPPTSNNHSASASFDSEPIVFDGQHRAKYIPEKNEPDQKSIQKIRKL